MLKHFVCSGLVLPRDLSCPLYIGTPKERILLFLLWCASTLQFMTVRVTKICAYLWYKGKNLYFFLSRRVHSLERICDRV